MTADDDRVEALESRVADLEATVNGLTKELVDATERIRELESELGMSAEQRSELPAEESTNAPADDTAKGSGGEGEGEPEDADAGDDIIVA